MAMPGGREMSRAERFEDEKRRIIESCFSKKDDDGSVIETYITHIRILEYASHPTSPPPPQARGPQSEKHRIIIIAVRKSGRVRVHKSKENSNGTFSIGKTWDLNDLSAIESYTAANTSPDFRLWASNVGFLITLGKQYYWQAQTDKEKKFFISSLLKIYGKYSGGKSPVLTGFDPYEMEQIQGGATRRPPPPSSQAPPTSPLPPPPVQQPHPPQHPPQHTQQHPQQHPPPPLSAREPVSAVTPPSSSAGAYGPSPGAATPDYRTLGSVPRGPPRMANGGTSPATSIDSGRSGGPPTLRRLAGNNKSQESVAASMTQRSDDGSVSMPPPPPRSRNGPVNGASAFALADKPAMPEERPPPERKRPPMDPSRPQGLADEGLVPAPLMSSARTREGVMPPPRSSNRSAPFQDGGRAEMAPPPLRNGPSPVSPAAAAAPPPSVAAPAAAPPPPAPAPVQTSTPPPAAPVERTSPRPLVSSPEQSPTESPTVKSPPVPAEPVETRPGLGPMIKKKSKGDIAGVIWKAAAAANAFKPRPGGAGDRLRQAQKKSNDGPDGITSVVPATRRPISREKLNPAAAEERPKTPNRSSIPEVKITVPGSSRPSSMQKSLPEVIVAKPKAAPEPEPEPEPEFPRKSIVVGNDSKYLATLGVDPTIVTKGSAEFAKWLDYFGWVPGDHMRSVNRDDLKIDLERELNRAQAGGWLARFQEEDERVEAIKKGIDTSIDECEELDNLLTLYSVELSTLSDDISYIEAQGQGLQVQAANQKLLKKELESLLDTCAITSNDLEALRTAPLETVAGIEETEAALVTLFKAMSKIDPSMGSRGQAEDASSSGGSATLNSDFGQMRIVREKTEMYHAESDTFMRRLVVFMASEFDDALAQTRRAMEGALSRKVDPKNHDAGRDVLWKYSPLVLYAREADLSNWDRILQIYQEKSQPVYRIEFRYVLDVWKKNARKPSGDESELLFTALQEKKEEGIATTARKITVKRSQTLARTLRSPLGDSRPGGLDKAAAAAAAGGNDSRSHAYEVLATVLEELLPLVQMEQNFVIDFFHATTLQQIDFADAVAAAPPQDRRGNDLRRSRPMEPDRELARRVTRAMEAVFSFLEQDLQNMVDWVLSVEALQGIGVLATLERKLVEISQSNQDFLNNLLQKLHSALEGRFKKFVDEQIRAIEETKVKIKKRKGVIGFMRIFPNFSTAVENMLAGADPGLGVCRTVDREYDRILRTMFDSLKVIARENPTMAATTTATVATSGANSADPEDKEALNFHILLIENMNHYLEDVENPRGTAALDRWKGAAAAELEEHMGLYLNAVMRRPLGRLLEHLENIEAQLLAGQSAAAVAAQPSNSKATFNKVLGSYDGREVRKGIETLRKRVEKHFGAGDDEPSVSRGLVARVLRGCESFYGDVELRIGRITTNVYGGDVLYEWPRADVKIAFSLGRS